MVNIRGMFLLCHQAPPKKTLVVKVLRWFFEWHNLEDLGSVDLQPSWSICEGSFHLPPQEKTVLRFTYNFGISAYWSSLFGWKSCGEIWVKSDYGSCEFYDILCILQDGFSRVLFTPVFRFHCPVRFALGQSSSAHNSIERIFFRLKVGDEDILLMEEILHQLGCIKPCK